MKKKTLKQDIEFLSESLDCYILELDEVQQKLSGANNIIAKQIKHIEMLDSQLEQQDKAIERKDKQFYGLKACYKDDLINGRLG